MAALDLPSQLAGLCWQKSGYGYDAGNVKREMNTPVGDSVIRIGSTAPDTFQVTAVMYRGRLGDFAAWWTYTLKNGSLWWNALLNAGGIAKGNYEVRFVGSYTVDDSWSLSHVRISATLKTRSGTEIDYTTYQGALAVGGVKEFLDLNDLLARAMNEILPEALEP